MQIEERAVGDVVVLDLKGKITLGEGDELLKDKVNSLVNQGHKKIVLNLADVPVHRQRGARRSRSHLHHREPAGRQPQAAEPDQAHHRSAVDHEAADRVRDLRLGERRGPEFLGIGQGLARLRALDGAQHFFPCGGPRYRGSTRCRARPVALNLLISLRPGQWTKNLLVFAGLLFGRRLFDPAAVVDAPSRRSRSSARCRASSTWSTTRRSRRPIGSIR